MTAYRLFYISRGIVAGAVVGDFDMFGGGLRVNLHEFVEKLVREVTSHFAAFTAVKVRVLGQIRAAVVRARN